MQAGRILDAWASGNQPLLQRELENSRQLSPSGRMTGIDEERVELLRAISEGMLRSAGPLAVDPAVRRCLDVLRHLAKRPAPQTSPNVF